MKKVRRFLNRVRSLATKKQDEARYGKRLKNISLSRQPTTFALACPPVKPDVMRCSSSEQWKQSRNAIESKEVYRSWKR